MGLKTSDPGRLLHRLGTVTLALFVIALLAAALSGTAAATTAQDDATSDVEFPISVPQGVDGGLATDGEFVYAVVDTGDGTDRVVRIDPESEEVVASYDMPFDYGSGLAVADGSLWVSSFQAGEVAEIDLDGSGTVSRFGVTGSPAGVAHANGSLWVGDPTADTVTEFSTDGEYRGQFGTGEYTDTVYSLAGDGGQLRIGDTNDSVSPSGVKTVATDGTLQDSRNSGTTVDAVATSRFGLLTPTETGDVQVLVDTVDPVADAGRPDRGIELRRFELDGTASHDPYGGNVSYEWTQTAGPSVTLRNASTATPEFTAPDVDGNATLTFEVNVTDEAEEPNYATDTVNVTVVDLGQDGERTDDATVFTAGQTNRIQLNASANVRGQVRDVIPASWTVYEEYGDNITRVETGEDGEVKYVYFEQRVRNETSLEYFVEAPDQTGRYEFDAFEVRATGFERASWQSVDGTGETVVVVGQDTSTAN